jgi:hypothetical protein
MIWDSTRGSYAPFALSQQVSSSPISTAPWVTPTVCTNGTAKEFTTTSSSRMVRRVSQDIEGEEASA